MNIKDYNKVQFKELTRIRNEVKWYAGETLGYDPDKTPEGKKLVEEAFAQVILERGAGAWLAETEGKRIREIIVSKS